MSTHVVVHHRGRELAGVVHEGESWAAAAKRTSASLTGEPLPLDLSGAVKHFVVDHDTVVSVRAMSRGDLVDLQRWRRAEHVHRWWQADGEPTPSAIAAQYGPEIDGTTPTRLWVAEVNGRAVGFVQDYRIASYPEFALLCAMPDAIGVDYAIGEPAWVGRGLGARILWTWAVKARHRFPDASAYFAAPDHRNEASLRMLDKAGFARGVWFDEPQADGSVATVVGCTLDVPSVLA